MNVQQVIDAIAAKTGLDPAAAERAAGTILSVLQQELDPATAQSVFAKLPGAGELAAANAVTPSAGGMLGSIASSILGQKAGVLAAGLSQLEASGLTLAQIQGAVAAVIALVRNNAGGDLAKEVADALPGLAKS